jgi:hypothetical protein
MELMDWFKTYAGLQHHPKRYAFEGIAETKYGLQYIVGLFCFTCNYAPDGDLTKFTAIQIARACEWEGDAELFMQALCKAGFLDKDDETCIVHDWSEIHQRFIKENEKRKPSKKSINPRVTQGLPLVEEKRIEEKRITKLLAASAADEDFNNFWSLYPNRKAKQDALKAWHQVKPDPDKVRQALIWQRKQEQWTKDKGAFIPLPASWLRGKRWEDEPPYQAQQRERPVQPMGTFKLPSF